MRDVERYVRRRCSLDEKAPGDHKRAIVNGQVVQLNPAKGDDTIDLASAKDLARALGIKVSELIRAMAEEIILSRPASDTRDPVTEYLLAQALPDGGLRLVVGVEEAIAEKSDFWDDELGDYDVPDVIAGKQVTIEGMYVVSEDLIELYWLEVKKGDFDSAAHWLNEYGWNKHPKFTIAWNQILARLS
jgi:hypothetical protein